MMGKQLLWWVLLLGVLAPIRVQGIRFVIDKKECWHHEVPYDGDQVHVSYVVIKSESMWSFDDSPKGVDLVVRLANHYSRSDCSVSA